MLKTHRRAAVSAFLAGFALSTLPQGAARAEMPTTVANSTVVTIGAGDANVARKIELTRGRSLILDLPRDAKEVFVANPAVANAVVRSTRKVFVIGVDNGATSIFVMDAEGRQIATLDVTIGSELKFDLLYQILNQNFPEGRFDIRSAGNSIILSGSVASAADAARAFDLAQAFVGTGTGIGGNAAPGGSARGTVINNLTVRERDQVMLRVTVVEVARSVIKQFGINTSGSWSALNPVASNHSILSQSNPFPITGGNTPADNFLQASVKSGGFSLQATLKAFEQAGVSRILAEPTLTAISGEAAKFTAGGEYPVPSSASCAVGIVCSPGITFKTYGVSLTFTPVVLSENRISVRVGTDVTEIDQQNSFNYAVGDQAVAVPGTKVRKSETTVELPSGGTMMTAGLIQQVGKQTISGLPGLINLPILGALFRSRDYQRQETELMIMVTPFIAKPMQPSQVSRPDDGFVQATDPQAVLLGRINKIYGVAGGSPIGASYRGRVGFIAD
ncbi:type II and III secretion system protein family protein [Methylobacterium organophilum]|uniref:type II and III secretion system protein family protein n=1 Tax=Methylobacterium organophilum TaxID=410 RepID=UPI001F12C592|nr:type II and III secretion system protein family protein [Methylobacterium organophilum]UMY19003.1 type II and III secretion system protein family protein [Methylobacterium organophilum]